MRWYVIHTKPRQEEAAIAALQQEKMETFFPKLRRKKNIRRKYDWVTRPLFPNYLFAQFDAEQSRRLVQYARGVTNIVSFGGKPAPVDDTIIAALKSRAADDVLTVEPQAMRPGDIVEIEEGPLRGLEAIFERELNGMQRVEVLLQLLHTQARVQISPAILSVK